MSTRTHAHYRKQVRGGDIARAIAFGTFPMIHSTHVRSLADGSFEVTIVVDCTGEAFTDVITDIYGCLRLAREVNKALRDLTVPREVSNQ